MVSIESTRLKLKLFENQKRNDSLIGKNVQRYLISIIFKTFVQLLTQKYFFALLANKNQKSLVISNHEILSAI